MARFGAPHGVRGLMHMQIFSRQPGFFAARPAWWCRRADAGGDGWQQLAVESCAPHKAQWLVKLAGVDDRDAAARWRNGQAALPYAQLPPPAADTFYWCDLVGMRVENAAGELLGEVEQLMDIGAHDVLSVRGEARAPLLIPFVQKHVLAVDSERRVIRVDWQRDW